MKIIVEFKIGRFQNFQQYLKIKPINIRITDTDIQNKLLLYARKYKDRFSANSLLFSSSIHKDTKVIFVTTNGLNDAKEILINGKIFQKIGVIYTSEIEDWKDIKTTSHSTNVVLLTQNIQLQLNIMLLDLKQQIYIICYILNIRYLTKKENFLNLKLEKIKFQL